MHFIAASGTSHRSIAAVLLSTRPQKGEALSEVEKKIKVQVLPFQINSSNKAIWDYRLKLYGESFLPHTFIGVESHIYTWKIERQPLPQGKLQGWVG